MARVVVNDAYLSDIADAIRDKLNTEDTYKPSEMAEAIESISGGGITPTGTKEITANGTNIDVAQYAYADVSVPNSYSAGDEGKVVSNGALVAQTSDTVTQNGTIDTTLINSLFVNVSGSGSGLQWELIGTESFQLAEYTDTTNSETTLTNINIKNTDYAFILTIITCDASITTNTEWGMSVAIGGRYTTNGNYYAYTTAGQKGSSTLSYAGMVNGSLLYTSYGVTVPGNTDVITFSRKAHGTWCPKMRGGLYTVSVYGLKSM